MLTAYLSLSLVLLHWALAIGLGLRVLSKRRPQGSAFAWIMLMLAIPYGGAVLYLIVGEVWLPRRRVVQIEQRLRPARPHQHARPTLHRGVDPDLLSLLSTQALSSSGMPLTEGNRIELLDGAKASFERLVGDIDAAEHSCHLLSYIWDPAGKTGEIAEALARAAARGVDCRVLVDAHGSAEFLSDGVARRLRESGVRVTAACPIGWFRLQLYRIDLRNHRKIAVIDERVGYAGSLNIADPAHFKVQSRVGRWVDCAARVTGPAVQSLQCVFLNDWALEHPSDAPDNPAPPVPAPAEPRTGTLVQVLPSGPGQDPHTLRQMLTTLVYSAREEVTITTPYFVPDEPTMDALVSVALGGVRVRVIVPERVDALLVRHASRAYYRELLDAGVEILHYRDGLLHSKTVTVDGAIAMLGSANMDLRSFDLNLEVSVFVFEDAFTRGLRDLQQRYADRSTPVDPAAWANRSKLSSLLDNAAQLVAPIL